MSQQRTADYWRCDLCKAEVLANSLPDWWTHMTVEPPSTDNGSPWRAFATVVDVCNFCQNDKTIKDVLRYVQGGD